MKTWRDGKGQYAVIDYRLALNDERFDENEKIPMNTLDVLEPLDITDRLEALGELDDGWLNGVGRAPDRAALCRLADAFERHYDRGLPAPWLYPTAEGGVQAEWTLGQWDISLDISLPALSADYQALNLSTEEQHDVCVGYRSGLERAESRTQRIVSARPRNGRPPPSVSEPLH